MSNIKLMNKSCTSLHLRAAEFVSLKTGTMKDVPLTKPRASRKPGPPFGNFKKGFVEYYSFGKLKYVYNLV